MALACAREMDSSATKHKIAQDSPNHSPKLEIEILPQEINDQEGLYRTRVGHRVHYLTIPVGVYDEDAMCRPYLLIPNLPECPDTGWTTM
jgi:hypothetical protein